METIKEQYEQAYKLIEEQTDKVYSEKHYPKYLFILDFLYNYKRKKYKLSLLKKLNKQYIRCIK